MKTAVLVRTSTGDEGTFGTMALDGHVFVTGELPDRDNLAELSCIPAGKYLCKRTFSNRFKRPLYQVLDVPGRTGIRFHPANLMGATDKGLKAELNGCIALGQARGTIDGQQAVLNSRPAVDDFEAVLDGEDFTLEVRDEYQETGAPAPATVG